MNDQITKYLLLVPLFFTVLPAAFSQNNSAIYKAQALYIYNFTKCISCQTPSGKDIVIIVIEKSPIISFLEEISKLKKVNNKPIKTCEVGALSKINSGKLIYLYERFDSKKLNPDKINLLIRI